MASAPPGGAVESALLLLLACCISLGQGQDRNWDLLNYHLYNAFSFVEGRFARDLYAAGFQTYFNPLIDVPYYLLSVRILPHFPRVVAFLAGIPFGLLIVLVLRIARIVLPAAAPAERWLAPIAMAIGVSGSATWSEIGTTYGDIPLAILVLTGLLVPLTLLSRRESASDRSWYVAMLVAGLLVGSAGGLKLTACVYAPGALLALTLTAGSVRRAFFGAVVFCASWAVAFALVDGWWALELYRRFQSPIFPLFNRIFDSPWASSDDARDTRFLPRNAMQALFYPFFWLRGRSFVVAEVDIRDPRFALAYLAILVLAAAAVVRRIRGTGDRMGAALQPAAVAVCIFVAVTYVVWEAEFSILRYALGVEALTGIVIVLAARFVVARLPKAGPEGQRFAAFCLVLLVVVVAVSSRPGWGRLRHYASSVFEIHAPTIPDDATILVADAPIAFALAFLGGPSTSFVGAAPGPLNEQVEGRLHDASTVLVLIDKPPAHYATLLHSYSLRIDPASCQTVANPFDPGLAVCGTQSAGGT
jgi:hypothetical protein